MFGWGGADNLISISKLATNVYAAYKNAPPEYSHISEEVKSLQTILESSTLSDSDRQLGQEVFKGCQSILEDLNSLVEKYNGLASANPRLDFKKVKLGAENITTLKARLVANTISLNGFIQRFNISTITTKYNMLISLSAVNRGRCMRCRHSWLMFLVYTPQTQVFYSSLLLPVLEV